MKAAEAERPANGALARFVDRSSSGKFQASVLVHHISLLDKKLVNAKKSAIIAWDA